MLSRRATRILVKYIIGPPFTLAWEGLAIVFGPLIRFLDKRLARADERRLEEDVRRELPFLFDELGGRILPGDPEAPAPGFDYAFLTIELGNLLVRFCRGRGDLDVLVGSKARPGELYDLPLVLSLIDGAEPDRGGVTHLRAGSGLLRARFDSLVSALDGDPDAPLVQSLAKIREDDYAATRELEWDINKRLRH